MGQFQKVSKNAINIICCSAWLALLPQGITLIIPNEFSVKFTIRYYLTLF